MSTAAGVRTVTLQKEIKDIDKIFANEEIENKPKSFIVFQTELEKWRVRESEQQVLFDMESICDHMKKMTGGGRPSAENIGFYKYLHLAWRKSMGLYQADLMSLTSRIKTERTVANMIPIVEKYYPHLVPVFIDVAHIVRSAESTLAFETARLKKLLMGEFPLSVQSKICSLNFQTSDPEQKQAHADWMKHQPKLDGKAIFGGMSAETAAAYYSAETYVSVDRVARKFELIQNLVSGNYGILMNYIKMIHTFFRMSVDAPELVQWQFLKTIRLDDMMPDVGLDETSWNLYESQIPLKSWSTIIYKDECNFIERITLPTVYLYHNFTGPSWSKMPLATERLILKRFHRPTDVDAVMTSLCEEFRAHVSYEI